MKQPQSAARCEPMAPVQPQGQGHMSRQASQQPKTAKVGGESTLPPRPRPSPCMQWVSWYTEPHRCTLRGLCPSARHPVRCHSTF